MAGIDGTTGQTLCLYIPSLWRLCYHLPFSHHSDRTPVAGNYAFSGKFPVSNWSSPRHCPFVEKSLNPPWFAHKLYQLVMDTHSSGEDFLVKARKPYTTTKQRERWTDGEHNKFLEALKLYGRAWRRIEEHIGTKTVVQIRSHAQKFFSKLEKQAHVSGVLIGQSIGIDIPPPRPRRKPTNPYPRKSSSAPSTWATSYAGTKDGRSLSSASSSHCKRVVDLEIKPLHERPMRKEVSKNTENQDGNSSDVFTLRREDHSSSVSSANNNAIPSQVVLGNPGTYREFVPSVKGVITQHATNESYVTMKRKENPHMHTMYAKRIAEDNGTSEALESGNTNSAFCKKFFQGEKAGHQNCAFHYNLEDYESFLCSSSTFSTLIVSSLLQNPAVHAAASSAAVTFWPHANAKDRKDPPSMASIAAATVTAATAWWAAHGLHPPVSMTRVPVPLMYSGQAPPTKIERGENSLRIPSLQDQQSDPKHSEAVEAHYSGLKSPTMPNSDDDMEVASTEEVHDSNIAKSRKQVYRSSYGSNTPSGSGVETDASKKRKKGKEELKETDINHPSATSSDHCSRIVNNMSDSWKEVSEEGRMAFQALFSREVLPQIFSLPHDLNHKGHQKDIMEEEKQNFQL